MTIHRIEPMSNRPEDLFMLLFLCHLQYFVGKIFRTVVIQASKCLALLNMWKACKFKMVEI